MDNLRVEHVMAFVEMHRYLGYVLLFVAMILEGETVLILAGMLASLKALDVGDVFWIAFVGVVLGNMFWYYTGFTLSNKDFAKRMIARAGKIIAYVLPRFHEKPFKSIFFSKFIYGANRATVFMSGVFKVHFRTFMEAEILASILWVSLYEIIGYFFGTAAIWVSHRASRFALITVLLVLVFMLLQKVFAHRYERKQLEKAQENNNA